MTKRILIILFVLFFSAITVNAQTKAINNLKLEQKKTLERLEMTSKLLEQNKQTTSSSLNKLSILTEQITERQTLISQINEEIKLLDANIFDLRDEIGKQQTQLESLKQEYAQLMYRTYLRSNSHDKLMFILSAQTISQSYRRLRYLQEFSNYRKEQAKEIEALTINLNQQLGELEKRKVEREDVLKKREIENVRLTEEKNNQQSLITNLKKQEKDLLKQLKTQQKQMDDLNDKITKLIAEEERKAKERAEAEAKKKGTPPPAKGEIPMTKEEQLIAGNFEKNKGRLPWPVERGVITGKFGQQPHAVLPLVVVNNKGIYIQTQKGADARCVFEGVVSQRFSIPGNNNAVIVRHGNYRTVYSNLTDIYVKEGDKVTAKQKIGKIYADPEENDKTVLYFMIWLEKDLQNPELFLSK